MHKFTIFSIIFSFMVILVVAELVVNDYFNKEIEPGKLTMGKASVLHSDEEAEKMNPPAEATEKDTKKVSQSFGLPGFLVTPNSLEESGFEKPVLRSVEFNGKYFQLIEVKEVAEGVKKANIFEDQRFAGAVYEKHLMDEKAALEFYSLLQNEGRKSIDNQINETDIYGNNSFYVNNPNKKMTAFLVVRINESVFAFEYPHRSHTKIKALIKYLETSLK